MSAPNILSPASITGGTAVLALTASAQSIIANAGASGKLYKVLSLYVANIHASATGWVTVDVYRSSVGYRVTYQLSVPLNATAVPIGRDAPLYLEEGDELRLTGNASSNLEAVAAYEILE